MDRFMMQLSMGLPTKEEECQILEKYMKDEPLAGLKPVLGLENLQAAKAAIEEIYVHKCVLEYMVEVVSATRTGENVVMGVSPRGTLAFLRCVKAYAYLQGRSFVTPDDVKALAVPVLAHRIVMGYGKAGESKAFIEKILLTTTVPTEDFSA